MNATHDEKEVIDHPENARTFSVDPTIQMPVSSDLRPTDTRIPLERKMRITALGTHTSYPSQDEP